MEQAYVQTPQQVLKHFNVTKEQGLSAAAVEVARKQHGRNSIPEDPPTPLW